MSFYETLISRLNKRFSSIDKPSIRRYLNRLFDDDRLQYRIEPDRFLLNNSVRLEPLSHYSGLVLNGIRIERKIIHHELYVVDKDRIYFWHRGKIDVQDSDRVDRTLFGGTWYEISDKERIILPDDSTLEIEYRERLKCILT